MKSFESAFAEYFLKAGLTISANMLKTTHRIHTFLSSSITPAIQFVSNLSNTLSITNPPPLK